MWTVIMYYDNCACMLSGKKKFNTKCYLKIDPRPTSKD